MCFWDCLGRAILLSMAIDIAGAVDASNNVGKEKSYSTVRNRTPPSDSTSYRSLRSNEGMGHIWEKASRIARGDIEALRLLNDADMMSMSLSSSNDYSDDRPRPPTPKPTTKYVPSPTHAPQPAPSGQPDLNPGPSPVDCTEETSRNEYIIQRLKHITPVEILLDLTTPQGKACNFLVNSDAGIIDHCSYISLEQRYGLVTFYFATNGENWDERSGWLGNEHECFWFGIDCDDFDSPYSTTRLLLRKLT